MSHGEKQGEVHGTGLSFDFPVESEQGDKADKKTAATLVFAAPDAGASPAAAPSASSVSSSYPISSDALDTLAAPGQATTQTIDRDFADVVAATASAGVQPPFDSIPTPPLASNDVVDTFWDIPAISIPSPETIAKREKIQARHQQSGAPTTVLSGGLPLFPGGSKRPAQAQKDALEEFDFDAIISGSSTALDAKQGSHKADPEEAPRSHVKQMVIAAIVLIVVVALAVGGNFLWRRHRDTVEYRQAMSACNAATGEYSKADADLAAVLRDTKPMQGLTPDQVADAKTVTTLRDAVSKANSISVAAGCPASLSATALQSNAKDAKRLTAALRSSTDDITAAAKAVTASKAAKDAANAAAIQANLKTATADAQTLLNNSLYSVADNSTRVALETAIKTANDLLGQNKPDAAAMQNALTGLQTASDAVKSSMNDLVVQNQIAAQQQSQQQYLQQQTPTQQSQQGQQNQQQTPVQPVVPAPPANPQPEPSSSVTSPAPEPSPTDPQPTDTNSVPPQQ
ncbi:MAG: FIVAR domain-containing protein [Bifidobacterium tibiigranuli]|jgi:hypothetical protein|uniref:FIVAR domain-containing protein n=1 Tax=Bifidobacterium tibiigranuli TaxID=2172043 RepID=UPI0023523EEF|nr:FIVAR domain-containing protein [Bifidobacterium tibiigranuli]MCH3975161.1 FIVAR domain-containing protein [Bifidobacterium tibiigranuli]MCH4190232.1 FIVAR domain-containing protein [Bifidobacterium tibiigranuli]MCH4202919.1 FIVAR domain-containing protein [Bifidobacterium tibiigranuli]MCH4274829.1 FIVAR domain-containing protein [Bifidobacterium tibiigranuli]